MTLLRIVQGAVLSVTQGQNKNVGVFHNMSFLLHMRNLTLCFMFVGVMVTTLTPHHWWQREA